MREYSFAKKESLKNNVSIKNVLDRGIPLRGRLINIYILKRPDGSDINRVAFAVRKHLYAKKLVLRNRLKRVLREAYRKTKRFLAGGHDVVILAVNIKENIKSTVIEREITDVFKKHSKK